MVDPWRHPTKDDPPNEMQPLWDWLHETTCGCYDALDNGTALIVVPTGSLAHVQHYQCGTKNPMRLLWAPCKAWLTKKTCPACGSTLADGQPILIAPQQLVRHLSCERAKLYGALSGAARGTR